MTIKCCQGCVAPKRHPGCHDHCPDYAIDKAFHNVELEIANEKKKAETNLVSQAVDAVFRAKKMQKRMKGRK